MGQQPSCIANFNVPQKKLVADYPHSQSMSSPRRSTQTRTLASVRQPGHTSTDFNGYISSMSTEGYNMSSPKTQTSSRITLKTLTIDDYESPSTSGRSLVGWLKRSKQAEFMLETPKGAAKQLYPHYCPICARHFSRIHSTSCCGGNCCQDCAVNYIATRQSSVKFQPNVELDLPCPNCHSTPVAFVALAQEDQSRQYVESPRTQALLEQSQARRQQEQFQFMEHHTQMYA